MLTPVDQPLDKLDDLQKDEMYAVSCTMHRILGSDRPHILLVKICEVRFMKSKLPDRTPDF